jgi:hypothetical protein
MNALRVLRVGAVTGVTATPNRRHGASVIGVTVRNVTVQRRNSSGNFATFAAIRRASSLLI